MIVWLVWEFAESPRDLRSLLRAYVAGSWVLAALTLANFASIDAMIAGQIRFVAQGQDPNDAARFLDLAFPLAAVLFDGESRWPGRLLALGYLPLGLLAVILTASRGGFPGCRDSADWLRDSARSWASPKGSRGSLRALGDRARRYGSSCPMRPSLDWQQSQTRRRAAI